MKRGENIIRLAWVFLGLLAIGAAAFLLGAPDSNEEPYSTSFDPSGAAAFAELLRQEGYKVGLLGSVPSESPKDRLAIAFVPRNQVTLPLEPPKIPAQFGDMEVIAPAAGPAVQFLTKHMSAGGRALILVYDPDRNFNSATRTAWQVQDESNRHYALTGLSLEGSIIHLAATDARYSAWTDAGNAPFATFDAIDDGKAILVPSGDIAMNAFIDQGDNAKFLLDMVHLLAPPGGKIDVIDGSISGQSASGLLDALGPWAHGIQIQLLVLAFVIVYTLGKRFGIADETPRVLRGARDLLDGIADTYGRSRAGKAALQQIVRDADRSIRRQIKLQADAPVRKRNDLLPPQVSHALIACEQALMRDPKPDEVLVLVRRLETELELFLSRRRVSAKQRTRRVKSA